MMIRLAEPQEFEAVRRFYHSLIDAMEHATYKPGWEKGIYPADNDLLCSINNRELFIDTIDGRISCAMVVNHDCNESYQTIQWPTQAAPGEVVGIHALGVHPDFAGCGLGKKLVATALQLARETNQKAVRLDVLDGNIPAEKLYTGLGFRYVDTIPMYYEDTGWTMFGLYEYPLE